MGMVVGEGRIYPGGGGRGGAIAVKRTMEGWRRLCSSISAMRSSYLMSTHACRVRETRGAWGKWVQDKACKASSRGSLARGAASFQTGLYTSCIPQWRHYATGVSRRASSYAVSVSFGEARARARYGADRAAFMGILQQRVVNRSNAIRAGDPGNICRLKRHFDRWKRFVELRNHWKSKLKIQNDMKLRCERMPGFLERGEAYFTNTTARSETRKGPVEEGPQ